MRKYKQYILYIIVILLSLVSAINTNDTSALSYQSNVGIGFTFNPTLSVSISPSDLVISNLVPGNTLDSNVINVSVASNASYGYTLSAIVNGDNSDLTHTNNSINKGNSGNNSNNIFGSIATNADLSSLDDSEDTNIWGYSYKNNTIVSPSWSNYNGLSSSNSTTLINTNNNVSSNLDFKIAAKASNTQPSGTYTGVINFTAVSNVAPMSLLDSFIASGAEQLNGYFKMQDMTHSICSNVDIEESELQLIDVRDNKIYWVAKLKDGNCWMTQNLDLDLDSNRTYTHQDTDLGWSDPNNLDTNATWQPTESTINFSGTRVDGWVSSNTEPHSANPGNIYYYTSNSDVDDIQYNSLQECINANHNDCAHYHAGNYYNWPATVSNNDTSNSSSNNAPNSICPSGWRLPNTAYNDFGNLLYNQNIITGSSTSTYTENGFNLIRQYPVFFARSGGVFDGSLTFRYGGSYWSSTKNGIGAINLIVDTNINISDTTRGNRGISVRCLAR